jgi:hypothetical protein
MKLFASRNSLKKINLLSALLIALCFIVTVVLRIILAKSRHSDLGGVEQNVIYSIQRLIFDGSLYSDPGNTPFAITQYTPIYHYICGLIAAITGQDPEQNIYQLYVIGRGANIIINLLSANIIYRIALKKLNIPVTLSAALGLGCFVCVFRQGFTVRPDSLMDLLMILSIYFFLGYLQDRNTRKSDLILTSLFSVAAIFAKQSGIQMPVIFMGFLIFTADWKGLKISILTTIIALSIFLGVLFLLYGDTFFKNVVGGVANGIDTSWFFLYVFGIGFKIKILIPAFFVLCITFYRWNIFTADLVTRFLCFCACAMFAFAGITVLKSGSNVAYFSSFFSVSLLLFAWKLSERSTGFSPKFYFHILLISYLCGICLLNVIHQYTEIKRLEFANRDEVTKREQLAADAANYVKVNLQKDDYIFANLNDESIIESSYGRRGINNILFKNCLIPQLDIFKSSNVISGVLGYNNFRDTLISEKTKYIIESESEFSFNIIPDFQKIKHANYQLIKQIGPYKIYQHN